MTSSLCIALLPCLFIHIYFVSWHENLDLYYRKFYFEMACHIRQMYICRNISLFVLGLNWLCFLCWLSNVCLNFVVTYFCTLRARQLILCWYQKNFNVQYLVEKNCFYRVIYLPYEPSRYFYTEYSELSELHLSICFNYEMSKKFKMLCPWEDVNLCTPFCGFLGIGPHFIINLMQSIFLWM